MSKEVDLFAQLETIGYQMLNAATRRDLKSLATLDGERMHILEQCSRQKDVSTRRTSLLQAKETDDAIHELLQNWRCDLKLLLRDGSH